MKMNIEKQLPVNVRIGSMFYKYKNIRMYRLLKNDSSYLTYWYSVLLLDEQKGFPRTGKLLVALDIRSLLGYSKETISGFQLIKSPEKIVPKLFRNAMNGNMIDESMFVPWDESDDEFEIEEI